MKIFFYTFGCKVNQYETEYVRERFLEKRYEDCECLEDADVCFINTCTVTAQADKKLVQYLHKVRKLLPECVIILAGCFPQAFSDRAAGLTEADIILGNGSKHSAPEMLERYIITGQRIVDIPPLSKGMAFQHGTADGSDSRTRAYIKIQDGCDQYCTYCIIPFARGHLRSKPLDEIVGEAKKNIQSGHKEIILTGINLCFYGRDLEGDIGLIEAVKAVCGIDGDFRVRLGSIEPELIGEDDIRELSRLEKLCPHFHLSLQSGCDATLKRMNRRYDSSQFLSLTEGLRAVFPDCAVTTDIMAGFPGESEDEFRQSAEFIKKTAFADAHIFPYSRRPGTAADRFSGQIDKKTKHLRAAELGRICSASRQEYLNKHLDKELRVLFERETESEWHCGHTDNYILVKVPRTSPGATLRRQFRRVRIIAVHEGWCEGELI